MSQTSSTDDFLGQLDHRTYSNPATAERRSRHNTNSISMIFKVIGWIVVVISIGIIIFGGIVYPLTNPRGLVGGVVAAFWVSGLSGLFSALMLFAISEIIQILHDIRAKLYKK